MGTRALVHIKEESQDSDTLVTICVLFDGDKVGRRIKKILNNGQSILVNGLKMDDSSPTRFNGMQCLAAYLIGALKNKGIGNVYIYPPDSKDVEESFTYTIWEMNREIYVDVLENKHILSCKLKDYPAHNPAILAG